MAQDLGSHAGAPVCAAPSDQRPRPDLPHPPPVRRLLEGRGPRLYDDEGPPAIVPRRDQRGARRGDAPWRETTAAGGRRRDEPGPDGACREGRPAPSRGPPAGAFHHRGPRVDPSVPDPGREDDPRGGRDGAVDEQPGLREGPPRLL